MARRFVTDTDSLAANALLMLSRGKVSMRVGEGGHTTWPSASRSRCAKPWGDYLARNIGKMAWQHDSRQFVDEMATG